MICIEGRYPRVEKELAREIKSRGFARSDFGGITDLSKPEGDRVDRSLTDLLRAEVCASTKINRRRKKEVYAFAKTDLDFTALSEHPDERVRDLVDARLSSIRLTIGENKSRRSLEAGKNGWALSILEHGCPYRPLVGEATR